MSWKSYAAVVAQWHSAATCAQCYERFTAVTSYADGDDTTLRAYLRR